MEGCILFGSYSRCATPEGVLQLRRRLGQGLTKGLPWGRRCSTLQAVDIERATEHQVRLTSAGSACTASACNASQARASFTHAPRRMPQSLTCLSSIARATPVHP
eukprot:SAG11_NODE_253_length_11591_cov_15.933693_10_plen_105_part_00